MTDYCDIKVCAVTPRHQAIYDAGKYAGMKCYNRTCKKEHRVIPIYDKDEWQKLIDDARKAGFEYDELYKE